MDIFSELRSVETLEQTQFVCKKKLSVSWWSKLSNVLVVPTCIGAHFLAVELDTADWFSIASGPQGCQVSCGIVPYGTASSNDIQQYTSELEVLACSIDTDYNYVGILMIIVNHQNICYGRRGRGTISEKFFYPI